MEIGLILLVAIVGPIVGILIAGAWFVVDDYKSGHTRHSEKFFGDE